MLQQWKTWTTCVSSLHCCHPLPFRAKFGLQSLLSFFPSTVVHCLLWPLWAAAGVPFPTWKEKDFCTPSPGWEHIPALAHNPADVFQSSKERRQAYRLHCFTGSKQKCSAIWSFITYFGNSCYTLTELTGEREASILRIPATRASFQHRENGFPSCQLSET